MIGITVTVVSVILIIGGWFLSAVMGVITEKRPDRNDAICVCLLISVVLMILGSAGFYIAGGM